MNRFKRFFGRLFLVGTIFACLLQTAARAQSTGSITGTVTDKSGAVIAGASVVVTDK